MSEIVARTFVVVFVLIYVGLLATLFGWNTWKQLGTRLDTRLLRHLLAPFRHLHLPHQSRNVH